MTDKIVSPRGLDRREFIRVALAGGATLLLPRASAGAAEDAHVDVWVIHGTDKRKLMDKCLTIIDANGGLGRHVKTLALKVNAAWARAPKLGSNTHPALAGRFVERVKECGVAKIEVPENPCNPGGRSFAISGLQEAVQSAGGKMYDLKERPDFFVDTRIPRGKQLTRAKVARQFLEADAVVNMPVAKQHASAKVSIAMKNWMGAVQDRGYWHRNNLHQCIADFSSFIKPIWTIVDATRIIVRRGPQGGSVKFLKKPDPNLLIVSKDQVAADAYATTLFGKRPDDVPYLQFAKEMGLGVADLDRLKVHRVEVSG